MAFEDMVAKWSSEFLEDDAALALVRERVFECGFAIEREVVERASDARSDSTIVRWVLVRNRAARGGTVEAREGIGRRLELVSGVQRLFRAVKQRVVGALK